MKYRAIVLMGAPGLGKTTIGKILDNQKGFIHYSNGEELRKLSAEGKLNSVIKDYMDKGLPIPADLLIKEIQEIIDGYIKDNRFNPEKDIVVLDGLPRDVAQLEILSTLFQMEKFFVFYCEDEQIIIKRLKNAGRDRVDDKDENVVRKRINIFVQESEKILANVDESFIIKVDSSKLSLKQMFKVIWNNSGCINSQQ